MKIEFDYSKLRGKIKEVYGTQSNFADAMSFSNTSLSAKLNNQTEFTQKEINKACQLLEISFEELNVYFFTPKVQLSERI